MPVVEKRRSERQKCFNRELIADYDGAKSPARSDFYWVTFQNISATQWPDLRGPGRADPLQSRSPRSCL
jgi:hypothetical protein